MPTIVSPVELCTEVKVPHSCATKPVCMLVPVLCVPVLCVPALCVPALCVPVVAVAPPVPVPVPVPLPAPDPLCAPLGLSFGPPTVLPHAALANRAAATAAFVTIARVIASPP